ncbi:MAG: hypothetical protein K2X35_07550 [Bryobacteraceae bacterium]|nr:hypothetical protein [Bryobacteraceae bacterium]
MRLLASVLWAAALSAADLSFHVAGDEAAGWSKVLAAGGFQPAESSARLIVVGGSSASQPAEWMRRLEAGAVILIEGDSPLARALGIQPSGRRIRVQSAIEARAPKLHIVWEPAAAIVESRLPAAARVFLRERWTGAPLLVGIRVGGGAALWAACPPGREGYERFPYILQALADLGVAPPFRSRRLWAFFDSSYRLRADIEYIADRWQRAGIGAIHVAAWHYWEADAERDAYLKRVIAACHRRAILVYAWIEFPHVSEKFWQDHPEWREQTAVLQDAHLDWRKLMNLANPQASAAAESGLRDLLDRFDWDGVNLAELYFESLEGAANPARFTPMNSDVRQAYRGLTGVDPRDLFRPGSPPEAIGRFLDFRASLAHRLQKEWLLRLDEIRKSKPDLDLVLTHIDDRFDTRMKELLGADTSRTLPLLDQHDFTFLIEDPATVWHLGPARYPEIASRYAASAPAAAKLAIDINIVERYQDVYPTKQQTGTELMQLVQLAARAFPRVALYFESSLAPVDLEWLSSAAAGVQKAQAAGAKLVIDSPRGVGLRWSGPALVDGRPWPVRDDDTLWLPPGQHSVEPSAQPIPSRILGFSGDLESAAVSKGGVEFGYRSSSRAILILDKLPRRIEIDGELASPRIEGTCIYLPRGQHFVLLVD